jgi:signal transduction histidine kinase
MENRNLALSALFDALTRNGLNHDLLIAGTELRLENLKDLKKRHSWETFLLLYNNLSVILGEDKAAEEIAYTGLYNSSLSPLRAIATGFIDAKTIYWYLARFACRHLFCDNVLFTYKKINSNEIEMQVTIAPELEPNAHLLKTYVYLWENVPTLLGLPKATVKAEFTSHSARYSVSIPKTTFWRYYFSRLSRALTGYSNAVLLMEELESQSIQLSKALEEKSELLRIMSHDISNSVTIIDYNLTVILKRESLREEDQRNLKKAKASAGHLIDILKNVQRLEVAQIKGVSLSPIEIEESFSAVREQFQHKLSAKNIELIVQNYLPAGTKILVEKTSFELNVLANLLSNAIKFSDAGSKIYMIADLADNHAVVSIKDCGMGITEEEKKTLFTKKIRKSAIGTQGEKGTGLGLGIVKYYTELYNGLVTVGNNEPKGTIFNLYLQAEVPQFFTKNRDFDGLKVEQPRTLN